MALHDGLSRWQKILLGILCFPFLPFYLCVYFLGQKTNNNEDIQQEEGRSTDSTNTIQIFTITPRNEVHVEEEEGKGQEEKEEAIEEVSNFSQKKNNKDFQQEEGHSTDDTNTIHVFPVTPRNKVHVEKEEGKEQEEKDKALQEGEHSNFIHVEKEEGKEQEENDKAVKGSSNFIHVEKVKEQEEKEKTVIEKKSSNFIHVEKEEGKEQEEKEKAINESSKFIHVKEEEGKGQEENEKTKQESSNFKYPWDKSNLKSLQIDLKAFEELDEYAAKLPSTGSLDHLTKRLIHDAHTDLGKVRAIWIWICHHIEYDIMALKNSTKRSTDPEEILRRRKGVCAGYSSLFEEMCSRAGVRCVTVSGYGKGAGYKVGQKIPIDSNHAWNMVYLERRWHLLDSTWGAGHTDMSKNKFTFEYKEYYFLTHPALFIGNHYPDQTKHQLLEPTVSREQFEQFVHLKGDFYNCGLLSVQPETGIIKTENGKVSITIQSGQNMEFSFDVNGAKNGIIKLLECGMELDVYLKTPGEYELEIYTKKPKSSDLFNWVLSYKILCQAVSTTMKIPKCLYNPVGPSWVTEEAGLVEPSHPEPVIYTEDGFCAVSFKTTRTLNFLSTLHSDEVQITSDMRHQHVFLFQTEEKAEIKVQLPRSGSYVLQIFIKEEDSISSSYNYLCNYLIICTNPSVKRPVFPLAYGSWRENFDLLHPLERFLPKNSNVSFKLQIPGVTEVRVEGETTVLLTLTDGGYWEGSCSTVGRKELFVMIPLNTPNSWQYILKYEVSK
ncbi:kyphoscoliosis peptidase-like isoform X2 [Dendropsophus ebraccatus]|uniref:kyphoscoliosis peptidase-like isoform X2 n=1 Tax=Dendropsophus ebraccatus TaxID=150705 RepID=UPI003831E397